MFSSDNEPSYPAAVSTMLVLKSLFTSFSTAELHSYFTTRQPFHLLMQFMFHVTRISGFNEILQVCTEMMHSRMNICLFVAIPI